MRPESFLRKSFLAATISRFGGVCDSGSRSSAISAILSDAQRSYAEAISVLLRNELYSSDELRELEMEIVRSDYSYGRRHWAGQSLGRVLSYEQRVSAPTLTQANALVLIADHQLWLSQGTSAYESALELYETAYRQLREGGIEQRTIDEIFTPELPVVLPAPLSNPLASSNTSGSAGYMDVVFGITKYGRPENIEILDTARGVTGAAERDLVQLITRRRFRPRVSDEHFPDVTRVTVRYYLAE
jgi:hypothetical protein